MTLKSALKVLLIISVAFAAANTYAATPTDACSLLTLSEVSASLGISVAAGQHVPTNNLKLCGWDQQGSSSPSAKRVVLSIENVKYWAAKKTPMEGITNTPISGIGDDALYIATPPFGIGLNVKKGDVAFTVRVYGFPNDQIKAKERALAQEALSRL